MYLGFKTENIGTFTVTAHLLDITEHVQNQDTICNVLYPSHEQTLLVNTNQKTINVNVP